MGVCMMKAHHSESTACGYDRYLARRVREKDYLRSTLRKSILSRSGRISLNGLSPFMMAS
jgi:hypothetical protein